MKSRQAWMYPLVVAALSWAAGNPVWAGGRSCDRCGCEKGVKTVCQLVVRCEEVELPGYVCAPQGVFHPDRGMVGHSGYRCDTFYKLRKNCDGTHSCSCHTVSGCRTLYGGKPTGCHATACVRQPAGVCPQKVPVARWVTSKLCEDCCPPRGKRR